MYFVSDELSIAPYLLQRLVKLVLVGVFVLFTSSSSLRAQDTACTYSVSGKILDSNTKEPIPYAAIKVRGVNKFTTSDFDGKFILDNLCKKDNDLIISCLGYQTDSSSYQIQHPQKLRTIYLTAEAALIQTVIIAAEKAKAKGTETVAQIALKEIDLKLDPTQTLAAVLSEQSGVTLISNGANVQLPVIHGLSGNRILILNNGLKHGFQNWGQKYAPEIDVSNAHGVTIVKGAGGVRYGPEALGGVINVENAPLYFNEPFKAEVGSGYQTNGRGYFANSEVSQGLEKWSYHFGVKRTRIGDRSASDHILTNTGKEEQSFNAGLHHHNKNLDFKLFYGYVDQNLGVLRSSFVTSSRAFVSAINSEKPLIIEPFSYAIREPNQQAQHHLAKAELNWLYADNSKLTFRYGKQFNRREEFDVRRNADRPIVNLNLTTDDYQLEWKHPNWKGLDGLIGVQAFIQSNTNNPGTGTTPFIPNYRTFRYSSFITESVKKKRNTYEAGARVDYELNQVAGRQATQEVFGDQFDFFNLTTSIGYIREIGENSSFRSNIGSAIRTPNQAELYSSGQNGFGLTYGLLRYSTNEQGQLRTNRVLSIEESGVEQERGYKLVNEFETSTDKRTHTLVAYSHYIDNYIFERPLGVIGTFKGPTPAFIFVQADVLLAGLDYSWKRKWSEQLSGTLSASYLWSRNISRDEPLINQPPIALNYRLEWMLPDLWKLEDSKFTLKPSYTFQQFQAPRTIKPENLVDGSVPLDPNAEIFDFRDAPDGYFLLDFHWNFRWKSIHASISTTNLLNVKYRNYLNGLRYFADDLGRNILLVVNYTFQNKKRNRN